MFLPKTAVVASLVPWRKKKVPDRKWIHPSLRMEPGSAVEEKAKTGSNRKNIGERSAGPAVPGASGEKGGATLFPPQATSRLASLADFFFANANFFLSPPMRSLVPGYSSPFPLHPALQAHVVARVEGFQT